MTRDISLTYKHIIKKKKKRNQNPTKRSTYKN